MRKICIITGSRSEYGTLKPLIEEVQKDSDLELQLIVTGMHLSPEFNSTYREIENDGFLINEKIETLLSSDTHIGITKSMGLTIISFSEAYERLKPDLIVVLGDRFEIFSSVVPALICKIPVAHIAGGEITQGSFDDALRHCITKMSHLHFTSTEEYRNRVIQLGETPERVFNVGAPGVDAIVNAELLTKKELEAKLGIQFDQRNLLVVYHPATLEKDVPKAQFEKLLNVLKELKNTNLFFIKSNADTSGRDIHGLIDDFAAQAVNAKAFTSIGHLEYLSLMKQCDAIIGNSSSGISEAPSLKVPTIDIGDRQKGRVLAESILHCTTNEDSIKDCLKVVYSNTFQEKIKNVQNPYGTGEAAVKIKQIIKEYNLDDIVQKEYFDLEVLNAQKA